MNQRPREAKSALPFALILLSLLLLLIVPNVVSHQSGTMEDELSRVIVPAARQVEALEALLLAEVSAAREVASTPQPVSIQRLESMRERRARSLDDLTALASRLSPAAAAALTGLRQEVDQLVQIEGIAEAAAANDPLSSDWNESLERSGARAQESIERLRLSIETERRGRESMIRTTQAVGDLLTLLLFAVGIGAALVVFRMNLRTNRFASESERARREKTALLESTGEGTFGTDLEGRCTFVNQAGAEMLGYTPAELVGRRIHDLIHCRRADGSTYPPEECPVLHTLRTGRSMRADDEVFWTRDGGSLPVEYGVFPLVDGGETRGVVVNFLDISARKEAERERAILLEREREARGRAESAEMRARFLADASDVFAQSLDYETALRSLARLTVPAIGDSYIVYLLDDNGEVQRAEPTHKDPAMQMALQQQLQLHPPRLDTLIPPVRDALTLGRTTALGNITGDDLRARPDDLEHDSVIDELQLRSLIVTPLRTRNRILGAISYGSADAGHFDSHETQQLVEELATRAALAIENAQLYGAAEQAIRAREEVIGIVSHDLRSPLNVVRMGAKSLLRHWSREGGTGLVGRQLEAIELSAERMSRLVRDLLDLVQIDVGRLVIHQESARAADLVEEAVMMMQPLAEENRISLTLDLPARLPALYVDAGRVQQVFTNLLTNAIKFTPAGGKVTVSARETDRDEVCFSVADTGCGIREEDLAVLFDRYWQAHQRSDRGGIGLGLAIAKGIVEGHHGTIRVESQQGVGTTFYFTLPASRITVRPSAAERNAVLEEGPRRKSAG